MRKVWVKARTLLGCLLFCGLSFSSLSAQNTERLSETEAEAYGDHAVIQADYMTMKNVRRYWVQEAQRLKAMKQLEFVLTGYNENILKVSVPARLIFNPNDSTMLTTADGVLRPLLRLAKDNSISPQLIIAAFHDNNGGKAYLHRLTGGRARSLHRWFAHQGVGPNDIHSYGFGDQVPRTDNLSRNHREYNRRISFYFVPSKKMLRAAKKGEI